jgi:hypothetical protein
VNGTTHHGRGLNMGAPGTSRQLGVLVPAGHICMWFVSSQCVAAAMATGSPQCRACFCLTPTRAGVAEGSSCSHGPAPWLRGRWRMRARRPARARLCGVHAHTQFVVKLAARCFTTAQHMSTCCSRAVTGSVVRRLHYQQLLRNNRRWVATRVGGWCYTHACMHAGA